VVLINITLEYAMFLVMVDEMVCWEAKN
jgi:hypothetical protein